METFSRMGCIEQGVDASSRDETCGVSRTSVSTAVRIYLLGAATATATAVVICMTTNLLHGIPISFTSKHQPKTPSSEGKSVPNVVAEADGIASALKSFTDRVNFLADEFEDNNKLDLPSHSVKHGRERIAAEVIDILLSELGLDVASVNLDICTNQRGRQQQPHEGDTIEGEEETMKNVKHASELSGLGIHVDDGTRDTSGADGEEHGPPLSRVLWGYRFEAYQGGDEHERSDNWGYNEDPRDDVYKRNTLFGTQPMETCVTCCPRDEDDRRRRTTTQLEDYGLIGGAADDQHRAAWIAPPAGTRSCTVCCDDDGYDESSDYEPTMCPPVPEPIPCPTPMPTMSCPEPVPCPTPPPTASCPEPVPCPTPMPTTIPPPPVPCPTSPPTSNPTPDTCIEPLENLEDFTPCDIELNRTYYRVRTFTVPEGCNVRTNGPLVVESVNATIHGSLIGKGEGGAGASGCDVEASLFGGSTPSSDADCSPKKNGQGSGGGRSSGRDVAAGGGGGGGYGGKGGDSSTAARGGRTYEDLLPGSGGGAGAGAVSVTGNGESESMTSGSGGNGGGLISFLSTDSFVLGANGTISVDGDDGGNAFGGSAVFAGGGGGGSGGGVEITACTAIIEGEITASGGDGGNGFDTIGGGGGLGGGGGGGVGSVSSPKHLPTSWRVP